MSKSFLITGATGKQGGSVLRALLAHPSFSPSQHTIYAVTRKPDSASAKSLAARSPAVKLVPGDLKNASAIFSSLPSKPWGVYGVTMPGKNEEGEGKALVSESVKAGVSRFVFSSVDRGTGNGGNNRTDVPHFITKHEVEQDIMRAAKDSSGKFSYTILRPVFFLDNLEWGFIGKVIATAWRDHVGRPLQVVDTKDVGTFGANSFLDPDAPEYKNKAISLAGDSLTFEQANDIFKSKTGMDIPTTYGALASLMLRMSKDMNLMFKFFRDTQYGADVDAVRKINKDVLDFSTWVDKSSYARKSA